jgi:hypothetical protein
MESPVRIHIVHKRDLAAGGYHRDWDDRQRIAALSPGKRQAILGNPLSRSDNDPVQLVGLRDNRVIGRLDLIAGEVVADGNTVPMLWTSSLFVPPEERSSLMGVMLVLKMQQLSPVVGACSISRQALPIFERLKWLDLPMRRYLLLRRSRAVIEHYAGPGIGGKTLSALADAGLLLHRGVLRPLIALRVSGLRMEPCARFPPELAPQLADREGPAQFHRSTEWMNWLLNHHFEHHPHNRAGLFLIRDRTDKPVAHVLLKAHFHKSATHRGFKDVLLGSLQDWKLYNPDAVSPSQLALLAVRQLLRWKVDVVELCLPRNWRGPDPRGWGFVPMGHLHCMVRAAPKTPLADRRFNDASAWNVRPAEGDNFFI